MSNYTAKDIKIPSEYELQERWPWKKAEQFANRYPHISPKFIERLCHTASIVNEPYERIEDRYLKKNKNVEVSEEFQTVYLMELRKGTRC